MKRGKPLRTDPAKTRAWQQRTRRALPAMSPRRRESSLQRAVVRGAVFRRDGYRCQMPASAGAGPCYGPLSYHHLRKASHGGPYSVANGLTLCTFHNDWVEMYPAKARATTVEIVVEGVVTTVALA